VDILANVQTADQYTAAASLEDDSADTITFVIGNASVLARFRVPPKRGGARNAYGPEVLLTPQTNSIKNVNGVQFRSAVAGTPARVVAQLTGPDDPQLAGGNPFTGTLTSSGQVAQQVALATLSTLLSAGQILPTSVLARVAMDTVEAINDPTGAFTFQGNSIRCNFGGVVVASGFVTFVVAAGDRIAILERSGNEMARGYTPGSLPNPSVSQVFPVANTDVIDLWAFQTSGANANITGARLAIARLS
jgi:hypothetical protein